MLDNLCGRFTLTANVSEKSLQININSVDDAKAVIQSLPKIKAAYDAHGCTSVEFAIAEEVVTPTAAILVGAIPWTTHYRKIVKPFEDNVLFQLPHYQPAAPAQVDAPAAKADTSRQSKPQAPGKSTALVQPALGAT